ncbi:nitrous oxide reductase accessory protein NosL [Alkalihalobacterium chitinilyticum]|uniref:Nitrous oxide reductase accessory protein NosL n=1 Tax=Alkalihalobacterium chitinilyticum TaxID=2980103 RepID=A0ABT5VK40_9BACI|nr:nitrous oxide reductase accessory protein NosL [Alkalihalobacterium chitinilyticum]MDE5415650.1 nitrous oxide reductase accessory protein NosL [Alkalihalobacterium chitinilyticum]
MLSGCVEKEYEPYQISEGVDICNECNMIMGDNQYATQIHLTNGQYFMFDDIGCHYQWLKQYSDREIAVQYVRDYHTLEWLEIEDAYFVYDASIQTPMGYGINTFKDVDEAYRFMDEIGAGDMFTFNDIFDHHFERQFGYNFQQNLVGTKWGIKND